ncbi:MAG: VWA domain-containing protein [Planctomycetes bacterium]|nr:VWA domain-containing protein [Planctomycetota bacterium]
MTRGLRDLFAWAGFGLLVWGAWLAFPRVPGEEPGPALRAVLVDASASAARRRPQWGARVREVVRAEARAAEGAGEELAVVLFGREVMRLRDTDFEADVGWLDPALEELSFGAATALDRALRTVEAEVLDSKRRAGRVLLVGDGEWTGQDPSARIASFGRAGVSVERVGLGDAPWPDLGILELRLPTSLAAGERLAAVCDLAFVPGAREVSGELLIRCEDSGGARSFSRPLALPRGGGEWSVSMDLGPCADGEVVVSASVRLAGAGALSAGDPVRENDRAVSATRAGEVRLGLATAEPGRIAELEAWLARSGSPGIQWEVVDPSEVGDRLSGRDVFLSYDISTASLPERWLGPFLEQGGGWLALGGWGLLSEFWPGGAEGSAPASEWLPLVPSEREVPEREVVFCVDGSGSMAGAPFDSVRDALGELVPAALPTDALKMRFFTGALGPVIEVAGVGRRDRVQGMRELFDARVPGGSTDILFSLEGLAEARAASEVSGLVLLLSDGRDRNAFQVQERAAAVRSSFRESETRLSVIAIGSEADLDMLTEISGPSGEVIVVEELTKLADLFRREVARERVREGAPTSVALETDLATEDLRALAAAWTGREVWPEVEQLARMEARGSSEVLLRTSEGLPLLAFGRVGEGWAACFPALLEEGWAPGFAEAKDVWAPLWTLLSRGGGVSDAGPRINLRGEELVLRLGAEGESWPAVVKAELLSLDGAGVERSVGSSELCLGAGVVPGVLTRRVGALEALDVGEGRLQVRLTDAVSGEVLSKLGLPRPLPQEFQPFSRVRLAEGALVSPARIVRAGLPVPDVRAPWVIGAAAALLAGAALLGRWRTS